MSKKTIFGFIVGVMAAVGITVQAAPNFIFQKNVYPETDSTFTLGSTTRAWLSIFTDELCLSGDCRDIWPTGGAGASSTIVQIADVTQNSGVPTLDFSTSSGFTITESPTDEFNISISTSTLANNHLVTNEWDLFIIAGQSNAVASAGTIASTTVAPPGIIKSYYNGAIKEVTNDLDPGNGGPWPGFGLRYYQLTGRKVAFVHTAVGGTGLNATSSGGVPTSSWGTEGTLFASSTEATAAAIAAYRAQGLVVNLKGVLWSQGENDAAYINSLDQTAAQYRASLESVISRYRTAFGTSTPFYIFRTGAHVIASDVGYGAVRQEQENVAATDANTYIVWRGAIDMVARGMMFDNVHYNQFGYNEMGRLGAEGVALAKHEPRFWLVSNALIYNTNTSSTPRLLVGNVGIDSAVWASSTYAMEIFGNLKLTGALADSTGATGTSGQVLSSTGTSTRWINASSSGGSTTFLDLTDTPSSFTANRIPYTNTGGTALTDSAGLTFDGTSLNIGGASTYAYLSTAGNAAIRPTFYDIGNFSIAGDQNIFLIMDANNDNVNRYVSFAHNGTTTGSVTETGRFYDSGRLSLATTTFGAVLELTGVSTANLVNVTTAAGADVLRVTSGGNVGIGTTSPSARLTISGDMRLTGRFADSSSSTGSGNQLLTSTTTGTAWVTPSALCVAITGSAGLCDGSDDGAGGGGTVYLASTTPWTTGNLARVAGNGTLDSVATSSLGLSPSFTTSAALAALLSDETGTGNAVFSSSPTFTGTTTLATVSFGFATNTVNSSAAAATTTNLRIYDPTNSNAWSTTNPWGCIDWKTGDAGFPSKVYWGLCQVMTATNGNNSNFHIMSNVNDGGLTTRMMISLDGDISIGTTTEASKLYVQGSGSDVVSFFTSIGTRILHMANSGLVTLLGAWDFGDATSVEVPNGSAPTVDATGEIAFDTTDNQLLVGNSGNAARAIRTEQRIFGFTLASTSPEFRNGGRIPVPLEKDGYTVTAIRCYVDGGTSVQLTVTDGTNAMDTLSCATTATSDDGSIANSGVTAAELMYVDVGTISGSPDYATFAVFGYYTVE